MLVLLPFPGRQRHRHLVADEILANVLLIFVLILNSLIGMYKVCQPEWRKVRDNWRSYNLNKRDFNISYHRFNRYAGLQFHIPFTFIHRTQTGNFVTYRPLLSLVIVQDSGA